MQAISINFLINLVFCSTAKIIELSCGIIGPRSSVNFTFYLRENSWTILFCCTKMTWAVEVLLVDAFFKEPLPRNVEYELRINIQILHEQVCIDFSGNRYFYLMNKIAVTCLRSKLKIRASVWIFVCYVNGISFFFFFFFLKI